jgi:hypothetical protein
MAGPAIGLPSDKHSSSDDEEPEHYYSNGAPRPAIPRRDTSANPDREMFPLSGDGDLSNGYGTFFGPLRQRKGGMMCSRGTQSTHTTAEVSVTDEELRPMHESISSDGGETDGWVTETKMLLILALVPGRRRARDPRRPTGPTGNQKRPRCRSNTPKHGLGLATTNTDCLSDLLGPIHRGQPAPNTNRNEPQLEQTYDS